VIDADLIQELPHIRNALIKTFFSSETSPAEYTTHSPGVVIRRADLEAKIARLNKISANLHPRKLDAETEDDWAE
jgi:hypothetical protein